MHRRPLIYAHRTAAGLYPENSLIGFKSCLEKRYDAIDMDLHLTKDDCFLLSHDPYLNTQFVKKHTAYVKEKFYLIKDLTKEELKEFTLSPKKTNYSEPLTFLEDIFSYPCMHAPLFQLEIKYDEEKKEFYPPKERIINALIRYLDRFNDYSHIEVQSFDFSILEKLHSIQPRIKTAFLTEKPFTTLEEIKNLGGSIWGPRADHLREDLVKNAHALGLKVVPWTVNTTSQMKTLINWSVDGIITDYPDKLTALYELLPR